MRRIYYRFPQRVDLSFAMGMPFNETLNHIADLDNSESTKTTGKELVKVKTRVNVATDRTTFGDITPDIRRPGSSPKQSICRYPFLPLHFVEGERFRLQMMYFT